MCGGSHHGLSVVTVTIYLSCDSHHRFCVVTVTIYVSCGSHHRLCVVAVTIDLSCGSHHTCYVDDNHHRFIDGMLIVVGAFIITMATSTPYIQVK